MYITLTIPKTLYVLVVLEILRDMSLLKRLLPVSGKKKNDLVIIREYLDPSDFKQFKKELKLGKIGVAYSSLKVSEKLIEDQTFPVINAAVENDKILRVSKIWNDVIEQKVREKKYEDFSLVADKKIKEFIAPHIIGMDEVKESCMLQVFSKDKIHLLLLGDPGTGKTDILRAIDDIAPISSFGLGSGTSSAGLTVTFKGEEIIKGLLPMADNGLCCVDELNLMRARDRGSLLNAMEKGFITYDKGNKHIKLDARISMLATANPKGDKFVGRTPDTWLKQIPFDPALLSRFHLVFFIRKPGTMEFINIAKRMLSETKKNLEMNDALFIMDYIAFSQGVDVAFNDKLKNQIVEFSAQLKRDEKKWIFTI